MCRLDRKEAFLSFVQDAFIDGSVGLIHLLPEHFTHLLQTMARFNLDFDDAYQYVAAEKHGLSLVSFDGDFDKSERGRKTPQEVLASA